MVCEWLSENRTKTKMVVFSGTYEKSKRISLWLKDLFTLVMERNTQTIPSKGSEFGYENGLKIFLEDPEKHLPVFKEFIESKNVTLSDLEALEIESIITMTSSRGIAKTGLSLCSKSVGI